MVPEIAVNEIGSYAGGLGILEGDKFLGASKLKLDYIVISFFYRKGYINYRIHKILGLKPRLAAVFYDKPREILEKLRKEQDLYVNVKNKQVCVTPWVYEKSTAKLILLEVSKPRWFRRAIDKLYIEKSESEKIYKWILFAKAAAKYIKERIGLDKVDVIDIQEAYAALIIFALPEYRNFRLITHTPGPWGHPRISAKIVRSEFALDIKVEENSITKLALERVAKAFAVSKKHYETCIKKLFPEFASKFSYVTNGVSEDRWRHNKIKELISNKKSYENISPEDLWRTHLEIKNELMHLITKYYKPRLEIDSSVPIIVWCRRLTKYKRPYFVIKFIEEIGRDLNVLFVVGGRSHPADADGLRYAKKFLELTQKYDNVVFIHDYDIQKAQLILSGGDIHLFTPFPGWEACGTSYMKAAVNGVPTLSSKDGGAVEMIVDGLNGWFFGLNIDEFIDISDDSKAKEIDKVEFDEFSSKLLKIIKTYGTYEYKLTSLNALRTSSIYSIERVLNEYYGEYIMKNKFNRS
ncbi:MAG: glycogen/starch/alpha-glucan phosphorylase [Ignisphaera sp.]